MARVVPSQVVDLIDTIFPWAEKPAGQKEPIYAGHAEKVAVIVDYVEQIPSELITLEGSDYAALAASLATMKHALMMWPTHGGTYFVGSTPGFGSLNPITLLRQALAKCADDAPRSDTADLSFIADKDFRESLHYVET